MYPTVLGRTAHDMSGKCIILTRKCNKTPRNLLLNSITTVYGGKHNFSKSLSNYRVPAELQKMVLALHPA